jgi:tetratricopeptide (TPR) repeat protein
MKSCHTWIALTVVLTVGPVRSAEPVKVADEQQRILSDYQRVAASGDAGARAAAGRLARDAYRLLIDQAKSVAKPSADDLYALGACHAALGDETAAREQYTKSLAASPTARTHLALARLSLATDPAQAEKHFNDAVKIQSDHPDLRQLRLALASAFARIRAWSAAVGHLEKHLGYTKALLDLQPGNRAAQTAHAAAQRDLDRIRRYAGMTGKPAPALKVSAWAQGSAVDLAALKGKVVVVDFVALWADASRTQMEKMKTLADKHKGVEVVAVSLANHHKYDTATDKVTVVEDLKLEDEAAGLAAYAKQHGLPFRLAIIDRATTEQYGVALLPHVVVIDKAGNVAAILLADSAGSDELEKVLAAAQK